MSDPIHQFVIQSIAPLHIGGVDVSFTNSALWMAIACVTSILFLTFATAQRSMIPNRLQASAEMLYAFVAGMIKDNIGSRGSEYFPLVFTIFMVVFLGNMLGLIPWAFTYTSHIIVTGALALGIFALVTVIGFAKHGLKFFSLFNPPGVPLALKFLVIPIEIVSFLIRPVTLSVRLFANMMAGHLVLKVFAGFSATLIGMGVLGAAVGLVPMIANVGMITLEVLIAFLQAYVFAILSCIYLKDAVDLNH